MMTDKDTLDKLAGNVANAEVRLQNARRRYAVIDETGSIGSRVDADAAWRSVASAQTRLATAQRKLAEAKANG